MKVAIMQPTYLPWTGYFDLMERSNIFVFLDDVQFEKQSWQQRNQIKTTTGAQWLTVPVLQKLPQKISEVIINNTVPWRKKHWNTIKQNYSKSSHWQNYFAFFEELYEKDWELLAELNIYVVLWLKKQLGITTKTVKASKLNAQGARVELLIDICKKLGADEYLSPIGSKAYIEENNIFPHNNIKLEYQNYEHPIYRQLYGDFIPYLSAVDLLFNKGGHSLEIIRSGRR